MSATTIFFLCAYAANTLGMFLFAIYSNFRQEVLNEYTEEVQLLGCIIFGLIWPVWSAIAIGMYLWVVLKHVGKIFVGIKQIITKQHRKENVNGL